MAGLLFSGRPGFGQYDGLVINEILPNPRNAAGVNLDANQDGATSVFDDEFVELLNTSTNSIDITGLWLTDVYTNIRRHVFSARILPPGGSMVVFGGGSILAFSNPPAQTASGGGLSLNNDTETVYLFSPQTAVVDQVSYQLTASHDAISTVRNPDGTGGFTNHYLITTNTARISPGRRTHGQAFLTNHPPVLLDIPAQTAFVGLELQFPVRAYDPADRDAITLSAINSPANSSFSATGGVGTFRFTATLDQVVQIFNVSFVAADDDGAETNTIPIQVINPNAAEDIWINEIHYDNISDDVDEGVEIAGTAGSVLTNYSLVLYNGLTGLAYETDPLTGTLDDEQCGFGAAWFGYPPNGLQNGPNDGLALVKGSNVIQFFSYEGVLTASDGPAAGMTSVDIGVREYNETTSAGSSLQLTETGTTYSAFTWSSARPHSRGSLNAGQEITCLAPAAIDIQKTVYLGHDGGASAPGAETVQGTNGAAVTYVFVVANTGGVPLTNTWILDASLGIAPIELGTLATGLVVTTHVEAAISGDLRNTATVSGEAPDGAPVSDEDSAEVVEFIPSLDVQITGYRGQDGGASCPGSGFLQATNGTPATFCLRVENNGTTNLNALTLSVDSLGIAPILIGTLGPGGMFATSVTAVVTGSLAHVAIASGLDPNNDPVSDQDSATVEMISPAIQLQKSVYLGHDGGASCPGAEQVSGTNGAAITYCFQVANIGDVALTNVVLVDPDLAGFTATNLGTLATGESAAVFFETTLLADQVNSATVTAFSVIGTAVEDADTAEVAVDLVSDIAIQFTGYRGQDGGASCPGSHSLQATNGTPATFCLVAENTGETELHSVVISADTLGIAPLLVGTLGPGGVFATSVASVVTASVTHVAAADGLDPADAPVGAADSVVVTRLNPVLYLQKTVYLGHDSGASCPGAEWAEGTNGSPITYCFRIYNLGNAALTNVVLSDPGLTGFAPVNFGSLTTGDFVSTYCESTLLAERVNSATVTAYTVIGDPVQDDDTASVAYPPPPYVGDFEYVIVNLGTLGGTKSEALGVNDRGQAVGWALDAAGRTNAFLWHNGHMTSLGFLPGGSNSVATAINQNGDITGYSYVSATNYHAFLYVSNMVDIGTLSGPNSYAYGINKQLDITGASWLATNTRPNNSTPLCFVWRNSTFIRILPFSTWSSCDGYGINELGRICGTTHVYSPNGRWWGFVWKDDNQNMTNEYGEMKLLGSLAVKDSGGEYSGAMDINDIGQVVGWTGITNTAFPRHAFLVTPSNGNWKLPTASAIDPTNILMQDLGALDAFTNNSQANSINNQSWIVGTSSSASGTNQAFLWYNGVMTNLNHLVASNSDWVLTNATGINEFNEIVGSGFYQGQKRAFMLRQAGRIVAVDPIMQADDPLIYTNELGVIFTQAMAHVETQVIQWAGAWGTDVDVPRVFTVEYCDALQDHVWLPFLPTSQWPIAVNFWTNSAFDGIRMRHFRVRAE